MINEKLMQYLWQNRLFDNTNLATCDGQPLEIIDIGRLNTDAGPDFFNAKVKIGGKLWAGNVEIHLSSSDWKRHGHDADMAYDTVILHVVAHADAKIYRKSGEEIPQLVMSYSPEVLQKCAAFGNRNADFPCAKEIRTIPSMFLSSWLTALLTERLMNKSAHISELLSQNKNNWAEVFYVSLARSLGTGINGDAFERMAKAVPLVALQKHRDSLLQIEALFFGVSGLLPEAPADDYQQKLCAEAHFLMNKFSLSPLRDVQWKMARLRPQNFPHVRIAQLSKIVFQSSKLFSKIQENVDYMAIFSLFSEMSADGYWEYHCTFSKESPRQKKTLGKATIHSIMINTVVPLLFAYGKQTDNETLCEKALALLERIPAERNQIITSWAEMGIEAANAYDTQALIELRKNYCDRKDCLRCRIAHRIISVKKP